MPWLLLTAALAALAASVDLAQRVERRSADHRAGFDASRAWLEWAADRTLSAVERSHHALAADGMLCDGFSTLAACLGARDDPDNDAHGLGFSDNQEVLGVGAALTNSSGCDGAVLMFEAGAQAGIDARYAPDPNDEDLARFGLIRGRVHGGYYQWDPSAGSGATCTPQSPPTATPLADAQRSGMIWLRDPALLSATELQPDRYHRYVDAPQNHLPHLALGVQAGWAEGAAGSADDAARVATAVPVVRDFSESDALRVAYAGRAEWADAARDALVTNNANTGEKTVLEAFFSAYVAEDPAETFEDVAIVHGANWPLRVAYAGAAGTVMGERCAWSDCWVNATAPAGQSMLAVSPLTLGDAADCPESGTSALTAGRLSHACLPGNADDPDSWAWALAPYDPDPTDSDPARITRFRPGYRHFTTLGAAGAPAERSEFSPDLLDTGVDRDNALALHWLVQDDPTRDAGRRAAASRHRGGDSLRPVSGSAACGRPSRILHPRPTPRT